jgi:hypothetical protein
MIMTLLTVVVIIIVVVAAVIMMINKIDNVYVFVFGANPQLARDSSFMRFIDHTTLGSTPLTTHSTHDRQISMPPVEFEPTISAGEREQTYVLDGAATGTGKMDSVGTLNHKI